MSIIWVLVIGIVGGLAGALQSQAVGVIEERAGTLVTTFITYGLGGLAIGIAMLAMRGQGLSELKGAPWWVYTAGLMGLVVIASLGITVSRLGLGAGLTLFTGATLILAALIESTGWFADVAPLDLRRVAGIAAVIAGTWLVVGGSASGA